MKRQKTLLCVISILAIIVYLGLYMWKAHPANSFPIKVSEMIMGIPVVEELDFLEGKQEVTARENPGIYFENTILPYSAADNTLYLSQRTKESEWVGSFSAKKGAFLCVQSDEYWADKETAIRDGHAFTLWMVEDNTYYKLSLVVSGMPVIDMTTERMEVQEKVPYEVDPDKLYFDSEDLYYGNIRVFDCGSGNRKYEITECNVRYHYKGATTSNFDKKGYALSLQDSKEENLDLSLLGMRADNSWKLNAMVTDSNRIREMTASQIWEQIDDANRAVDEPGPRMEYVELVVDNDYKGLYCLVEPIDEKKLKLDGNDVLYKCIGWGVLPDEDIQYAIDMKWRIMSPIRIRYPEVITDYGRAWYPIRDFFSKICGSAQGNAQGEQLIYPENAYDMRIFLMVVNGADNYFKNMYFVADVKGDGSYAMRLIPWDLDYTFGNEYSYGGKNATKFDPDITKIYPEVASEYLINYSPESVNEILVNNWYTYRADFLSTDSIQQLMIDNRDYLINSGVVTRENNRWPKYSMDTDIQYLLEFQEDRMNWLDGYFGGLAH